MNQRASSPAARKNSKTPLYDTYKQKTPPLQTDHPPPPPPPPPQNQPPYPLPSSPTSFSLKETNDLDREISSLSPASKGGGTGVASQVPNLSGHRRVASHHAGTTTTTTTTSGTLATTTSSHRRMTSSSPSPSGSSHHVGSGRFNLPISDLPVREVPPAMPQWTNLASTTTTTATAGAADRKLPPSSSTSSSMSSSPLLPSRQRRGTSDSTTPPKVFTNAGSTIYATTPNVSSVGSGGGVMTMSSHGSASSLGSNGSHTNLPASATAVAAANAGVSSGGNGVTSLLNSGTTGTFTIAAPMLLHKSLSNLDARMLSRDVNVENTAAQNDGWHSLCLKVLPLFNGEGLKAPIEELNALVRRCLRDRILTTFHDDINELLETGMLTLSAKLSSVPEDKLITRLVEIWSFFLGTVLPYLEGVFMPLQTEIRNYSVAQQVMDVRTMTLTNFRDRVLVPIVDRVQAAFDKVFDCKTVSQRPYLDHAARALQMTSLLCNLVSENERHEEARVALWKLKSQLQHFIKVRREYEDSPAASVPGAELTVAAGSHSANSAINGVMRGGNPPSFSRPIISR